MHLYKGLRYFRWATLISTIALLTLAAYTAITTHNWAMVTSTLVVTALLAVLEIGLSFDNAVINAKVLETMNPTWQRRFLTWGILIAVFGMRLVIPVVIVAGFGHLSPIDATIMAFSDGKHYGEILHSVHTEIAGFGGMFLAMVFLTFMFEEQQHTWFRPLERQLQRIARRFHVRGRTIGHVIVSIMIGVLLILTVPGLAPPDHQASTTIAMIGGLTVYLFVYLIGEIVRLNRRMAISGGAASFLYLEVLDASFSFDGVIGAFALTTSVAVIMAGLGIGALFVRSTTVFLVQGHHLAKLPHLGHAAHYAIGALATIMFLDMRFAIPEVFTGLMGAAFIALGVWTSTRHNRSKAQMASKQSVEPREMTSHSAS